MDFLVFMTLVDYGPLPASEVAKKLGIPYYSAYRVLENLVKKGAVRKVEKVYYVQNPVWRM